MNIFSRSGFALSVAVVSALSCQSLTAREIMGRSNKTSLKTTAVGCEAATAAIDLDINNIRARMMTGGDMWWNIGLGAAAYEIPKGSGKHSQFAASCWIGGYDQQNQLKVAAQTYRQDGNDYWPGALDRRGTITRDECSNWDRFWKIDKSTIIAFVEAYKKDGKAPTDQSEYKVILEWPARGNGNAKGAKAPITLDAGSNYAPFVDLDADGVYEPNSGEYPDIRGDQFIWWVTNDAGNTKQQTGTASMFMEVQTSAFAYSTQDFLNNATFYNYRVINKGDLTIDSTYIAVWDDCDLGYYLDDFIGCDTTRGLGIMYNGESADGARGGFPPNSYGANPPQVGVDFFSGPLKTIKRAGQRDTVQKLGMTNFTYYNNDNSVVGNPTNGQQIYFYMTGSIRNGEPFRNDYGGPNVPTRGYGSGPATHYVFTGDPGDGTSWSECASGNQAADRRFIFSSGPFQLIPGAVNDITFGCVWANGAGGCPSTSFRTIKSIDDEAQALFEANFRTVEGPEAPRLIVRELNNRLIFYLVNDYGSNNYAENYGRDDVSGSANYRDSLRYHQTVLRAKDISDDTLYRFEGYRVFQLANGQITPAEIFDPNTGEVDGTKAKEVFQCDKTNKITKIVNYVKQTSVSDSTWVPQIKIVGRDSGVKHSFQIEQDEFAPGSDRRLVNYRNYYFVAIAYAYNQFAKFDPLFYNSTQDKPYIGSSHGAGGISIPVVAAMPNPSNGEMGTSLNADYGDGVVITRVQGVGNGGNYVELSEESIDAAVNNGAVGVASYKKGQGPFKIQVVDPVKVPPYNWVLQLKGSIGGGGILSKSSTWSLIAKDGDRTVDTIYGEREIAGFNEQIVEKYGLSLGIEQVDPPGLNQSSGNGYITSTIEFEDPSNPWMWGVVDQQDSNVANWIRSGNVRKFVGEDDALTNPCDYNDIGIDSFQSFGNMLANFSPANKTWAPYYLAAYWLNGKGRPGGGYEGTGTQCPFLVAYSYFSQNIPNLATLPDVNIVLTKDKRLWTRCAVIDLQEDSMLSENSAMKFTLRRHAGWNGDVDAAGNPVYSTNASDRGMSWFPGYAVDLGTGQRLNIIFGEDSYASTDNGADMIWNPTSREYNFDGTGVFGGRHVVYVRGTKYDSCKAFISLLRNSASSVFNMRNAYDSIRWIGMPMLNPAARLLPLKDGLIPNKVTLRFRVNRPFGAYGASDTTSSSLVNLTPGRATLPYYTFKTTDMVPVKLSDTSDRQALLDRIKAVPNPYYGYSGYEGSRFDTKVRIINLPARASINIYSLDGTLVRRLSKSDAGTAYMDWDIRNTVGLPVASGMYIMHVQAEGIGETIIKWFGAARPIDAPTY